MTMTHNQPLLSDSLAATLRQGLPFSRSLSFSEPPGAACAAIAEALRRDPSVSVVVAVLPTPVALDAFCLDVQSLSLGPADVHAYPMLDLAEDDPEAAAARLSVLNLLRQVKAPHTIIATCVQAMLQPSPDPEKTDKLSRDLASGETHDMEKFLAWLGDSGYRREPEVFEINTFAVKGGIVDVWPTASRTPVRIEFFGDIVESLRAFNCFDQRSTNNLETVRIPPAKILHQAHVLCHTYIPDHAVMLWIRHDEINLEAESFAESASVPESRRLAAVRTDLARLSPLREIFIGDPPPPDTDPAVMPFGAVNGLADADAHFHDPSFMSEQRHKLVAECLHIHAKAKAALHFCLDTAGTLEHLAAELGDAPVDLRTSPLSGGFTLVEADGRIRAIFLSQSDLYGHSKRPRARSAEPLALPDETTEEPEEEESDSADLASQILDNITPGDLVVHIEYGIGRYTGTREMPMNGHLCEVLCIEYANRTKLFVPVSHANLISRYKGTEDTPVKLHAIGGKRWSAEKASAQASIQTLAMRMLETQARRKQLVGFAFSPDTPYLQEFEASFPYTETPGQAACIKQVKQDLVSPHPMDRLVCGDAGYGKTEVAIRAAFICAMQGRQVAVLVPTTVLAQQHYDTFRDRLAAYPLNLAMHSRFCSKGQRDAALEGVANGTVDILIGTHGILQPDIRFKNLGLVIIDEEQRFGVRHKEFLKTVRLMVDVLTLSATPIPRTLYLGLTGARDLSLLQTPPRERVATETKVVRQSDEMIVNAILAEINRGGQVFYLHNRVLTIEMVHQHLTKLLPHIRIGVGHGQMAPSQIERIMRDFSAGKFDVLLSTTIIESGIDIPRANTIIIDRADRFGIADLYQLRGRVGRAGIKAFAYFMIPQDSYISPDARLRLKALQQHAGLGSGVSLAMRDLSIRGAGNLLGAEQSGHIAAIGFNLYCQLLRRAVARLKGEKPPLLVDVDVSLPFLDLSPSSSNATSGAFLPYAYLEDDAQRIEFHRRLAECSSAKELKALERDTADRFGTPPPPLKRLLALANCRIVAAEHNISRIEMQDDAVLLYRDGNPYRNGGVYPRPIGRTADERLASITNILRAI